MKCTLHDLSWGESTGSLQVDFFRFYGLFFPYQSGWIPLLHHCNKVLAVDRTQRLLRPSQSLDMWVIWDLEIDSFSKDYLKTYIRNCPIFTHINKLLIVKVSSCYQQVCLIPWGANLQSCVVFLSKKDGIIHSDRYLISHSQFLAISWNI